MNCRAVSERGIVVEQAALAEHTYRLRLRCPAIARQIVPGQFFMVRIPGNDPLLGRPFALYDVFDDAGGRPEGIDFVYHTIGKATTLLSSFCGGETVDLWGPLGNGFPVLDAKRLVCVGGGIGYTPFLAVAREAAGGRVYGTPQREVARKTTAVTLLYGVRNRRVRADLSDFAGIPGFEARLATDDGSEGRHGFVTELLQDMLTSPAERPDAVFCCGPEPMMHAAARLCAAHGVACWLSLETPMACGFGACFSCVTRVRIDDEPGWDYRRTCVEGPIFRSSTLVLD
jgi:dihydroorotate dehydrogenase electron transfer subunit